jgi:hypothetical protein
VLQAEFDGIENRLSPGLVAVGVEVELVCGEETRIRPGSGVEQRRGHVDDTHPLTGRRQGLESPVELGLGFEEMPP